MLESFRGAFREFLEKSLQRQKVCFYVSYHHTVYRQFSFLNIYASWFYEFFVTYLIVVFYQNARPAIPSLAASPYHDSIGYYWLCHLMSLVVDLLILYHHTVFWWAFFSDYKNKIGGKKKCCVIFLNSYDLTWARFFKHNTFSFRLFYIQYSQCGIRNAEYRSLKTLKH